MFKYEPNARGERQTQTSASVLEAARQQRQSKRRDPRAVPATVKEEPPKSDLTKQTAAARVPRPVKQKRALLKSNSPRDNGMRRRNENVSPFWGGQNLPENF